MPLWNLTLEKVEELVAEKEEKEAEVASLRNTSEKDLWFKDLDALDENLDQLEEDDAAAEEEMQNKAARGGEKQHQGWTKSARKEEESD